MDHVTILAIVTLGIGYGMVQAGLAKSALEWRRSSRRCPSCGRQIRDRVCSACAG